MALVPKISLNFGSKCDKVTFTENTGVYNVTTNPTGWGAPNIDTSNITVSVVEIYDSTGADLLDTYSLTALYATATGAPTPSPFIILADADWEQADGIYQIKYKVTDDSMSPVTFVGETQHELFLCNLCTCLQGRITKLLKSCDAKKTEELKTQVDQIEIFIYGIKSAFSCGDFTRANNLITSASLYCQTLSDCGCGCGGC